MERLNGVGAAMISTDTMTLGRFVRVTLNNFRQLMRNINAPITSPMTNKPVPMPQESDSPILVAPDVKIARGEGRGFDVSSAERATQTATTFVPIGAGMKVYSEPILAEPRAVASVDVAAPATAPAPAAIDTAAPPAAEDDDSALTLLDQVATTGLALPAVLESLLFVADGAVEPAQLARACGVALATVEQGLADLAEQQRTAGRGIRLQERSGRYQLVTAPETGVVVEAFLQVDVTARLSGPALETLAVIAYRQPVTRAQVEAVRGVDCSGVLRSLMQRGLIEETGRLEAPGRPVLYGITELFLNHFGLTTLRELPPLAIDEQDRMDEVLSDSAAPLVTVSASKPAPGN